MSIINEALKKTGQLIQENEAKSNPQAHAKNAHRPYLLYILIMLLGITASKFIFVMLNQKIKTTQPNPVVLTGSKEAVHLVSTSSAPAAGAQTEENKPTKDNLPAEKRNFVLNGIFYSNNDGYALINNQIVRENDTVDGATVIKITARTVDLDNQGEAVSLSTLR